MTDEARFGTPDFREARRPSRVYRGVCESGRCIVTVTDSALGENARTPRELSPIGSRHIKDCCEQFGWGSGEADALQLAIALLFDVSGDVDTALRWHERFAATYVRILPATWTVPEVDIALWLYCFENARPDA